MRIECEYLNKPGFRVATPFDAVPLHRKRLEGTHVEATDCRDFTPGDRCGAVAGTASCRDIELAPGNFESGCEGCS